MQYRNNQGRYKRAGRITQAIAWGAVIGYMAFAAYTLATGWNRQAEASTVENKADTVFVLDGLKDGGCTWKKTGNSSYRCSTPELDAKWKSFEESRKPKAKQAAYHKPFNPKHSKKQIEVANKIIAIAKEEGAKDIPYLLALADCESSLGANMRNAVGNTSAPGSVDRGFWMFNSRWHPDVSTKCADDITCSTKTAIKKLKGGTHWWCQDIIEGEQKTNGRIDFYRKFISN